MSDEAAFLDALTANPADDTLRLVYADWCDERDEPVKAQYLRAVADLARLPGGTPDHADAAVRLYTACARTDARWRAEAGKRFDVVLERFSDKIRAIKLIRERTGYGLGEAKALTESAPTPLLSWLPFEIALPHLLAFAHPSAGTIGASVRPTPWLESAPGAVFDVLLCESYREPDYWSRYATQFLARWLNLDYEQAVERLKQLPLVVGSGLAPADVATFVRELKMACNVGRSLPPGAIRVVPRPP